MPDNVFTILTLKTDASFLNEKPHLPPELQNLRVQKKEMISSLFD